MCLQILVDCFSEVGVACFFELLQAVRSRMPVSITKGNLRILRPPFDFNDQDG
jgi:hypothetical protein